MTEMINTKINGKYELILPKHRADRPEWTTGWEVDRIDAMVGYLKTLQDPVVYDIGVEEGDITALLAKYGKARIVMFEPNKRVWPNVKAIWQANKLPKPLASYVGFAANESSQTTDIQINDFPKAADGEIIGDHGFLQLGVDGNELQRIQLDHLSAPLPAPNLITLDVEGAEFEVLKGAEKLLREHRPVVYCSVHPEFMYIHYGQWTAHFFEYMKNLNYDFDILTYDHEFHVVFMPY